MSCSPLSPEFWTPDAMRQRQLTCLKLMRDSLETRLAATNAAIETLERQQAQQQDAA